MLEIFLAATIAKGDFVVDVQTAKLGRGTAEAVFKLTNHTDGAYQRVFVKCVFFNNDGIALGIGPTIVSNVAARGTAFGSAKIVVDGGQPRTVSCDVDQVTP